MMIVGLPVVLLVVFGYAASFATGPPSPAVVAPARGRPAPGARQPFPGGCQAGRRPRARLVPRTKLPRLSRPRGRGYRAKPVLADRRRIQLFTASRSGARRR